MTRHTPIGLVRSKTQDQEKLAQLDEVEVVALILSGDYEDALACASKQEAFKFHQVCARTGREEASEE